MMKTNDRLILFYMKFNKKILFILAGIFLFASVLSAQESQLLRYKYDSGETYRYKNETKYKTVQEVNGQEIPATGMQNSIMRLFVEKTDDKSVTLIHSLDVYKMAMKMTVMDTSFEMKENLGKRTRIVLSPDGAVISVEKIDTIKNGATLFNFNTNQGVLSASFPVLPQQLVKTGDKWSNDRSDSASGTGMHTTNHTDYTIENQEMKNGHSCIRISYTGKTEIIGKMEQMGIEFYVEGNGDLQGVLWFDATMGLLIAREENLSQESTIAMTGQMQMTIPSSQTVTTTISLIEEK